MRILIICHDFPPLNSSASRRPYSWARAWADAGHDVHVLTTAKYAHDRLTDAQLDSRGFTVHAVPYLFWSRPEDLTGKVAGPAGTASPAAGSSAPNSRPSRLLEVVRRVTRGARLGLGLFTEKTSLAYFPMVRAGRRLLAGQGFDLIVSTSGPDMCPMVGARLAHATGVRWLSDYRDLWFEEFAVNRYAFTTWCVDRLQSSLIRRADMVSTVSKGLAGYIERIASGKTLVCYNGYLGEPAALAQVVPVRSLPLRVVYTGTFYPLKRDPDAFFAGLKALAAQTPEGTSGIQVDFYGPTEEWVREQSRSRGLDGIVTFHGNVPYAQSLAAQEAADLLLFIDWMDDRADGVLTGKLFEYLAAGRPILCIGSRGNTEAAQIITECRAGAIAIGAAEVASCLQAALAAPLAPAPDAQRVLEFSRRAQAGLLLAAVAKRLGLRV